MHERMLQVSPLLAQEIGLEEALLLQLLLDAQAWQGQTCVTLTAVQKQLWLPFWSDLQLGVIVKRMQAQGILSVEQDNPWVFKLHTWPKQNTEQASSDVLLIEPSSPNVAPPDETPYETVPIFTMNEARQRNQQDDDLAYLKQTPVARGIVRRTRMQENWEPSEQLPHLLSFHNIPIEFALSELGKFRQYYLASDKQEANWDVRLVTWVQREWHNNQQRKGRYEQQTFSEPTNHPREKRARVRDALRNIEDTDW